MKMWPHHKPVEKPFFFCWPAYFHHCRHSENDVKPAQGHGNGLKFENGSPAMRHATAAMANMLVHVSFFPYRDALAMVKAYLT